MAGKNYFVFILIFFIGCVTYTHRFSEIETNVWNKNYLVADSLLNDIGLEESEDRLLFFVEKGIINHYLHNFEKSNKYFQAAEKRIDELYTKSISKIGVSFITNDESIPYQGEDFENILIHYYQALNYFFLGSLDDALIECRKMNLKLKSYAQNYENDDVYKVDAFILYLMGLFYEANNDLDDAYIAYRNSYEAYKTDYKKFYNQAVPEHLQKDLLRLSEYLDFYNEYEKYKAEFSNQDYLLQVDTNEMGSLVILFENGLIPTKKQKTVREYLEAEEYFLNISLPVFERRNFNIEKVRVNVNNRFYDSELVEDLEKISIKNGEDKNLLLLAKTIIRAKLKYELTQKMEKELGPFGGLLGNIFSSVTEIADTRSWISLPANIQIVKIYLTEGKHNIDVKMMGNNGIIYETYRENVKIEKGKSNFLSFRSFK